MTLRLPVFILSTLFIFSCSDQKTQSKPVPLQPAKALTGKEKPPASYPDTLRINFEAAVFYCPDSFQLQKMRSQSDPGVEARMHEYDFLMRTSRVVIKKQFPALRMIEAKNVKYLLFESARETVYWINLDEVYDACGLYVFNRQKPPLKIDMANAATDIGFYLSR